ncbi:hypothetical protein CC78DRAFT_576379 [Lojkania enalia]|uniref:Amidohydrolase-related domain-containing protein n=1 Tax=Lojkania enalia TaxID=147567 RepID=A0A9P4KI95_9PLEO|nr:hypothetical protein CC78DRAFT_576379 [Didymosphaeria enalia]
MPPQKLLDTHVHLWPSTSTSPTHHPWMTPGHPLAKQQSISEYKAATSTSPIQPSGFIYVETDRYLPSPSPSFPPNPASSEEVAAKLKAWAKEPLEELKFLRRIVEGQPAAVDGFEEPDAQLMKGAVIWAPFHLPTPLFTHYLQIAEEVCGPWLWSKVVGFRYLLQGIKDEGFLRELVLGENWLGNVLRLREGRGRTFDVGVDAHAGGLWQVEVVKDMICKIRGMEGLGEEGRVGFVINHLCKPDLSLPLFSEQAQIHTTLLATLSLDQNTAIKFSGAFSEFYPSPTPADIPTLASRLLPYVSCLGQKALETRVMFGSDWPVCNVGGPKGERSWVVWREVVGEVLRRLGVEEEGVWWRAGCEVYGVEA